jgi:hypothetical protein
MICALEEVGCPDGIKPDPNFALKLAQDLALREPDPRIEPRP